MRSNIDATDRSLVVATAVALIATTMFAYTASQVLPRLIYGDLSFGSDTRDLAEPLILAVALIILAWRRACDVRAAIEAKRAAKAKEFSLAYLDDVTGLHNRRYLNEVAFAADTSSHLTVLLLDLDGFKKVNDLYGHACGDTLLAMVAGRLKDACDGIGKAFRLGGDEFAVCLREDAANREETSKLAARLVETLNQPFAIGDVVARIGVSIGVAGSEQSSTDLGAVLHRADIAMYEAKRLGRNRHVWFDIRMQDRLLERTRLEAEIRAGIELGQFVPYFQPQFELSSSSIKGFEVLARWEHPVRGTIMPDEFIPLAEETGLISELSNKVMLTALQYARDWPSSITIAANLSPIQFKDPLLADRILALLREVDFPPERLELELTESAILKDKALALQTVTRLKKAGVKISLDDFGTGYASLSQLRELPFDRIKIDKSFIATLLDDKQNGAIVEAIATLGRGLSLPITAEGVETETVQKHLIALGCTDAQGWYFGKPVTHDEAAEAHLGIAPGEALSGDEVNAEITEARPNNDRRSYSRRGQ